MNNLITHSPLESASFSGFGTFTLFSHDETWDPSIPLLTHRCSSLSMCMIYPRLFGLFSPDLHFSSKPHGPEIPFWTLLRVPKPTFLITFWRTENSLIQSRPYHFSLAHLVCPFSSDISGQVHCTNHVINWLPSTEDNHMHPLLTPAFHSIKQLITARSFLPYCLALSRPPCVTKLSFLLPLASPPHPFCADNPLAPTFPQLVWDIRPSTTTISSWITFPFSKFHPLWQ